MCDLAVLERHPGRRLRRLSVQAVQDFQGIYTVHVTNDCTCNIMKKTITFWYGMLILFTFDTQVQVTVENSRDPRLSECMACQVAVYANTHVLVGLHGAGTVLRSISRFILFVS